ncbi:hypothetical protein PQR53_03695 [Paraburkholderia fungorum]|uniref:hypothetical protein n=1 Tax=Paraburkholderia fungorum TaxID=134537 RepID=UPI0038BB9972
MNRKGIRLALAVAALTGGSGLTVLSASAAPVDGSKPLLCATIDAHDCDAGELCLRALPAELGAPQFLRIDFAKKTVVGPERTTAIRFMDSGPEQILMQGTEMGFAWTIALDKAEGTMTVTLVNHEDTLVLFGACIAS